MPDEINPLPDRSSAGGGFPLAPESRISTIPPRVGHLLPDRLLAKTGGSRTVGRVRGGSPLRSLGGIPLRSRSSLPDRLPPPESPADPDAPGSVISAQAGGLVLEAAPHLVERPDVGGEGIANPLGLILSAALTLARLGEREAADRTEAGVRGALGAVTRAVIRSADENSLAAAPLSRLAVVGCDRSPEGRTP